MNKYIRSFWGTCFVPLNGSFLLAKGERIVKISTTFLPGCNTCVVPQASSITFGSEIKNTGALVMPISGVNECDIISTGNTDNAVTFLFDYLCTSCNDVISNCDIAFQVAFEIESDNLACCKIANVVLGLLEFMQPTELTWSCLECSGNVSIVMHNLTSDAYLDVTACVSNGLPTVLCVNQELLGIYVEPPFFTVGDEIQAVVCCCSGSGCCSESNIQIVFEG
jgi:hypothetical protein